MACQLKAAFILSFMIIITVTLERCTAKRDSEGIFELLTDISRPLMRIINRYNGHDRKVGSVMTGSRSVAQILITDQHGTFVHSEYDVCNLTLRFAVE
jgi:hypothetical protein